LLQQRSKHPRKMVLTLKASTSNMYMYIRLQIYARPCSADGSTHTESNKRYRKVKHRARPNLSLRQRPKRAPTRRRSRRRQKRGEPHTEHGLGVLFVCLLKRAFAFVFATGVFASNNSVFEEIGCDDVVRAQNAGEPSFAVRYLEKKTRRFFFFFFSPRSLPVSPGQPEVDPTIDQNTRSEYNRVD